MRRFASAMIVLAIVTSCSEQEPEVNNTADVDAISTSAAPSSQTTTGPTDPAAPAVRVPENESVDVTNWLARTYMDANSVELVWSPVEDADGYRLYRLPTAEADYDAIAAGTITAALVYEGSDYGFIDRDMSTGTFLTYVLVADLAEGRVTEPRWTEALTIDDVTPPSPIQDLTSTRTNDGVLLEWSASADDVEFAAYNVSLLQQDGTLRYLGGGADEAQTSFLDNDPLPGLNQYVVTAVDFHDNASEPAQVDVEVDLR